MKDARALVALLAARFPAGREGFRLLVNADCALHEPHNGGPETPSRLIACLRGLAALPPSAPFAVHSPPPAAWRDLRLAHDAGYVSALESCLLGGRPHFMHPDCSVGYGTDDAVLAAAGLALGLGDTLAAGGSGFAFTRPPGHHAGRAKTGGFCFANHAALVVRRIREKHPGARVAVADIDLHHGDGTQDCLAGEPGVFFASLHAHPLFLYPGTGFDGEDRDSPAVVRNIPLHEGATGVIWLAALDRALADMEAFRPDFLVVSLGLDGHADDPNAFFRLADEDFLAAASRLRALADRHASGRLGVLLEGGYSAFVLENLIPRLALRFAR